MQPIKLFFGTVRWLSVVALIAVATMGFFTPISVIQALVFNPILLLILMTIFVYSGIKQTSLTPNMTLTCV